MDLSGALRLLAADEESLVVLYAPYLGIPLVLATIIAINVWFGRRRTRACRSHANRSGFVFLQEDRETRNQLIRLPLFARGRERKLRNVMKTEVAGVAITVGDYSRKTETARAGESSGLATTLTVCVAVDPTLDIPHFYLRKRLPLLDAVSGAQDLQIADDAEFSKSWLLRSSDPDSALDLFDGKLRQFFKSSDEDRWEIEGQGSVIVIHNGKRIRLQQSQELIEIMSEYVRAIKMDA